ncbi:MAG: hypothetical protein ACRDWI_09670 [Jiangellaceae bacterium]
MDVEQGRREIDVVIEYSGGRPVGIEIRADGAPEVRSARHLPWLRDEVGDRFVAGIVLHTGGFADGLDERTVAAPICSIWGWADRAWRSSFDVRVSSGRARAGLGCATAYVTLGA